MDDYCLVRFLMNLQIQQSITESLAGFCSLTLGCVFYTNVYAAVACAEENVMPPSQSTDTAQAGSPTTASTLFPPPVMLPETTQSLILKEDITSLPSIISFPAPIRPPTESVVSETIMVTSSTVHPVICAGAVGSYVPPNPTRPPTRRLFSPLTVMTVPLTLQSVISAAPQGF